MNQLQQIETLTGKKPQPCFVDRGYKGSGVEDINVLVAGQKRSVPKKEKPWMGRQNSIEPIIGHLKSDETLRRCDQRNLKCLWSELTSATEVALLCPIFWAVLKVIMAENNFSTGKT